MKLTRMIFDYWKYWMEAPEDSILWGLEADTEGLGFYDGYSATFWYLLNVRWYKISTEKAIEDGIIQNKGEQKFPEMMTVNYDTPMKWGDEPLAKLERDS